MADQSAFSYQNLIDAATLVAGSQASSLPVGNLKDRKLQKVWRTAAYSTYFTVDFGADVDLDVIGLFGATLSDTDTVRIRLSALSMGAGEVVDTTALASGVVDGYGQYVYVAAATKTGRYLRIDIDAESRVSPGYFDVGRAWAGPLLKPAINFTPGHSECWEDPSIVDVAKRSGVAFVDEISPFRSVEVAYDALSTTERQDILDMQRITGTRSQIIFIPATAGDLARGPLLGRIVQNTPIAEAVLTSPARFSGSFTMKQDL